MPINLTLSDAEAKTLQSIAGRVNTLVPPTLPPAPATAVKVPAPAPAPTAAPTTAPGLGPLQLLDDGFPAKVLLAWHTLYGTVVPLPGTPFKRADGTLDHTPRIAPETRIINGFGTRPDAVPVLDPTGKYMTRDNQGTGAFICPNMTQWDRWSFEQASMQAWRDAGNLMPLTIGGASGGFNWTTIAQADAGLASIDKMQQFCGGLFTGVDFDLSENQVGSTPTIMVYACQKLKDKYGPKFSITYSPTPTADWPTMLAMLKANVLTAWIIQCYDWDRFKELGAIAKYVDDIIAAGLPANKLIIGFGAGYNLIASTTLSEAVREATAAKAKHPDLRGFGYWNTEYAFNNEPTWPLTMWKLLNS
jgi:hypothetical protein